MVGQRSLRLEKKLRPRTSSEEDSVIAFHQEPEQSRVNRSRPKFHLKQKSSCRRTWECFEISSVPNLIQGKSRRWNKNRRRKMQTRRGRGSNRRSQLYSTTISLPSALHLRHQHNLPLSPRLRIQLRPRSLPSPLQNPSVST